MELKEKVQEHIDRLLIYGKDYEDAVTMLQSLFPLHQSYSNGYRTVSKPYCEPNKRRKPILGTNSRVLSKQSKIKAL